MIHRDNIPHPGSSICVDWIVSTQSFDSQFLNRQFTELHGLCWIQKLHWPTWYETECHVYEESDKNAFTGEEKKVYSNYIHEMVLFLSVQLLQERCEGIVDRLSERGEWIKVKWVMCRVLVGSGSFHGSFLFLFNIAFRFLGKSSGLLRDWGDDLLAGRCHKHLWIQQVSVTRKCAGN